MIKVNLLKDHSVHTRSPLTISKPTPLGLMTLLSLVLAVVAVGAAWYYLRSQVTNLTESRDRLRVESNRLKALNKQIEQFDKMKKERQSRIELIEQLQSNQTGPVYLLNHVIHSIPTSAALWLNALEQKGDQIRISGFTVRGETIPDFMSNLSATGFFKTVDLELYEDQQKDAAAKFTLLCVCAHKMTQNEDGVDRHATR